MTESFKEIGTSQRQQQQSSKPACCNGSTGGSFDHVRLTHSSPEKKLQKSLAKVRRKNTVSGVTEEARLVLECYLKRSFSQSDSNRIKPFVPGRFPRIDEHTYVELNSAPSKAQATPYESVDSPMSVDVQTPDGVLKKSSDTVFESDLKSQSFSYSARHDNRSGARRSSSDGGKYYASTVDESSKISSHTVASSAVSKTTTDGSKTSAPLSNLGPSVDSSPNESDDGLHDLRGRKKKSGFKRASERIRQSFRRNSKSGQRNKYTREPAPSRVDPEKEKKQSWMKRWFKRRSKKKQKEQLMLATSNVTETQSLDRNAGMKVNLSKRQSVPATTKKSKESNGFGDLLQRLQSFRSKKKPSMKDEKDQRSRSADNLPLTHELTQEQRDILLKYSVNSGDSQPSTDVHCPSAHNPGNHAARANLRLESLGFNVGGGATAAEQLNEHSSQVFDAIDGVTHALVHATSKPFEQKSETEKEELYDYLAGKLALIGDNYSGTPMSPKKLVEGDPAGFAPLIPTECTASVLQSDVDPALIDLTQNATYDRFSRIMSGAIGDDHSWQQIALLFRVTQTVVQIAGIGTTLATRIKDYAVSYFEQRFAKWIIDQGGWESMVDSPASPDSELD